MEISACLELSKKGVEELERRVCKLSMTRRSVLMLLSTPRSMDYLIRKSVYRENDLREEIGRLLAEGFVVLTGDERSRLHEEIVLSEARFLLTDFCVDCFGTRSQAFVDEISASSRVSDLSLCVMKISAALEAQCPQHLPAWRALIDKVNETA